MKWYMPRTVQVQGMTLHKYAQNKQNTNKYTVQKIHIYTIPNINIIQNVHNTNIQDLYCTIYTVYTK